MNEWMQYLSEWLGVRVRIEPYEQAGKQLPIFVGGAYDFYEGELLDQHGIFLVPKRPGSAVLPDMVNHYSILKKKLEGEIVFVLAMAKPYEIKRLIHERIPFVVPGQQIFLPRHIIVLRVSSSGKGADENEQSLLSARAQALLLFHLQKQSLTGFTQIQIARAVKWKPMTVSRAIQELQHKRLCHSLPSGPAMILSFDYGRNLWERAAPYLQTPVKERRFVRIKNQNARVSLYEAGVTALSRLTMISEDAVPVHAIHGQEFSEKVRKGYFELRPYQDSDCVMIERWQYDPAPLAIGRRVDSLSLYLSLRDNPDERIQGALKELLETIRW
ncbi:MAG TPA: hypothetical protein DCZ95_13885 [Verrucomicrobia bacterium]|nr:MAG: hypothetical protein A2X46_01990 [Lentisphaerae bacterium GWF2_57_35]HBA85174.1 hypothetical protein [Verrucomicrobiota bacterium]